MISGSSAVNATIALRGVPADYDEWAALGNDEWDRAKVLPHFRGLGLETTRKGTGEPYGRGGPVPFSRSVAAWASRVTDHNHPKATGMCPFVKQAGPAARLHGDRLPGARQARGQPDHPAALPGQPGLCEAMARPPWRLRARTRRRPSCFMARTRSTSPIAGQR